MALKFNVNRYNKVVRELKSEGYRAPTELVKYPSLFGDLVFGNESKRSGEVRTYQELVNYRKKKGWRYYSEDTYYKELNALRKELGSDYSKKGFLESKKAEYKRSIDTAFGYENAIDVDAIPLEDLRDILNEAWRATKADPDGSPTFYEHLIEVMQSYGYY